ncbi:MAG: hypothetical protein J7M19_08215 [Planctomycetes bacterium]|nr:hypothetical protein [Planctomycetota bacterium]
MTRIPHKEAKRAMLLFEDVAHDPLVRAITKLEAEEADTHVDDCPHRGTEHIGKNGTRTANCAFLSEATGEGVGVCRVSCRRCIAHGAADLDTNPYLRQCVACCAYMHTVGRVNPEDPELRPTEARMAKAIDNMKATRGDAMAVALTDALYLAGLLTSQQAADALINHGLGDAALGAGNIG